MRRLIPVAATAALVILGCGESSSGTSGPSPPSGAPDEVVVRVVTDGGFAAESREPARLPEVSVFGDGRVITQGPTTLEYPGPALPNLQEFRLTRDGVAAIVDEARAEGACSTTLPPTTATPGSPTRRRRLSLFASTARKPRCRSTP